MKECFELLPRLSLVNWQESYKRQAVFNKLQSEDLDNTRLTLACLGRLAKSTKLEFKFTTTAAVQLQFLLDLKLKPSKLRSLVYRKEYLKELTKLSKSLLGQFEAYIKLLRKDYYPDGSEKLTSDEYSSNGYNSYSLELSYYNRLVYMPKPQISSILIQALLGHYNDPVKEDKSKRSDLQVELIRSYNDIQFIYDPRYLVEKFEEKYNG